MPEHFNKNTLECTAWCAKCQRMTQHRVDSGRRGPCIDPQHAAGDADGLSKKQRVRQAKSEREQRQPKLF